MQNAECAVNGGGCAVVAERVADASVIFRDAE